MRQQSGASGFAMLVYWLCVASIGNLIDYVPIRTSTDGTDLYQNMFAVKKGFGWSPWTLLIAFGNPTAAVLVYYFLRIMPSTLHWLFPASPAKRLVMVVLTSFALFDFYAAAGWSDGGPVLRRLSVLSVAAIAPLMMLVSSLLVERSGQRTDKPIVT